MVDRSTNKSTQRKINLIDLILTGLTPILVGKTLIMYFGSEYSANPDEGYGYGLAVTIAFTFAMITRFIWKYRSHF